MALCWSSFLLVLAISTRATASSISLSSQLTNIVPNCAQQCFVSFLDINFPASVCSSHPTLDCLCSHNSTSGYTVGEGALQCIISEDNAGNCKGINATQEVALDAFAVCNGQDGALPNTHSVITATFIVESSSPSIVVVAPGPTTTTNVTTSTSSLQSASESTFHTSTRTAISGSSSVTSTQAITSSPTITSQSTTPELISVTATSTSTSSTTPTTAPAGSALTPPQIAGIAVGTVGGIGLALAAILLFTCLRQRKARPRDSDLIPFQLDPNSNLNSVYGMSGYDRYPNNNKKGPGGTSNGVAAKIPPPIPLRLNFSPNMFSRRSLVPETIGLAVSEAGESPHLKRLSRRSSKLLPEKPILRLKVPEPVLRKGASVRRDSKVISTFSKQSTGTQFDDDYDDDEDGTDTAIMANNPWERNPDEFLNTSTGNWQSIKPGQSMVRPVNQSNTTEEYYHWRPGQASVSSVVPDYYIKPLSISRQGSSFSQPRQADSILRPGQPTLPIPLQSRPVTASSSVYSAKESSGVEEIVRNTSVNYGGRPARKSYKEVGPYDAHKSSGSMTSFETIDSTGSPVEPRTAVTTDLSPVVESPASGKSPVNYPPIPGRMLQPGSSVRLVPNQFQPRFAVSKPWRQAELDAQRKRAQNASTQAFYVPMQNSASQVPLSQSDSRNLLPSQVQPQQRILPSAYMSDPFQAGTSNLQPRLLPSLVKTPPPPSRSSSPFSHTSKDSSTSSLAARRRGEHKAATLTLNEDARPSKWRVLQDDEIKAAKQPGWRPQLVAEKHSNNIEARTPEQAIHNQGQALPRTPGWKPRLTPTRRGNDLFLSVQ